MKLRNLKEVEEFLFDQIPSFEKRKFPGQVGLDRTKYLMKLLGDPQEKIKIIHIAGTSGKGSTAHYLSQLLGCHGFKVGLSLSPHLVDIRERAQVGGKLLSEKKFVGYMNTLLTAFNKMKKYEYGTPTYFELVQALAFLAFYKERVDYAVIETGMGGTYDATNVVKNNSKMALITKLGLDHTKILGKTIKEIASQKAGIIQRGNTVLSVNQTKAAERVIDKVVLDKKAKLTFVRKGKNFRNIEVSAGETRFDFKYPGANLSHISFSGTGAHQAQNLSLALCAFYQLSKRDGFRIIENKLVKCLKNLSFPGRFDLRKVKDKKVIIDGAHNPQKMRAFLTALKNAHGDGKYVFLLAFKKGKDYKKMLNQIIPHASKIFITTFLAKSDMKENISEDPESIAKCLKDKGFRKVEIEAEPHKALKKAVLAKSKNPAIVTGSLYLAGEIYKALEKDKLKR